MKCNKAPNYSNQKHGWTRSMMTGEMYCSYCRQSLEGTLLDEMTALLERVDELEAKIIELQSQQNECP